MKSASKKFVALILAIVMMFSVSAVAFATEPEQTENEFVFSYCPDEENEDYNLITGIDEIDADDGVLTIPVNYKAKDAVEPDEEQTYTDVPISGVAELAFTSAYSPAVDLSEITKLVVEDGIKLIGAGAFIDMPALEEIVFKGDIEIAAEAFSGCTALETVTFEGDATLGEYAFSNCDALKTINADEDSTYTAPKSALNDTYWYKNTKTDYVILGTTLIEYKGAEEVETIPQRITKIGAEAFKGNPNLKKVVFNSYIDTLGDRAFAICSSLEEVVFNPAGEIKNIGVDVFADTPYFDDYQGEFFTIGNTLVKYKGEGVPFVAIPNTITAIAPRAFEGAYKSNGKDGYTFVISSILVPVSVTELGEDCFVLVEEEDGSKHSPRIYAYDDTSAMTALEEAGYVVESMQYWKGDLDKNGKINAADARYVLRLAVGLEEPDMFNTYAADLDGDRKVTAADARILLRIAVGLEDYTLVGLHAIPTTKVEILNMYKKSLTQAAKYNMGYIKETSNAISDDSVLDIVNKKTIVNLALTGAKNEKLAYVNYAALKNLPVADLDDTKLIKFARCDAKAGKYYITMKLYDVLDCNLTAEAPEYEGGMPYIASMIPVVSGREFFNAFAKEDWFTFKKDVFKANYINRYSLQYTDPTITAVIDIESGKPEEIKLSVGYDFVINGKRIGSDFDKKCGLVDTTVERLDVVTYTNFK